MLTASLLAQAALDRTRGGVELVEFAVAVLRGQVMGVRGDEESDIVPSTRERLEAMKFLAEVISVDGKTVDAEPLDEMSDAELLSIIRRRGSDDQCGIGRPPGH